MFGIMYRTGERVFGCVPNWICNIVFRQVTVYLSVNVPS